MPQVGERGAERRGRLGLAAGPAVQLGELESLGGLHSPARYPAHVEVVDHLEDSLVELLLGGALHQHARAVEEAIGLRAVLSLCACA